ncbi:MAG TPA: biotin--[acetyl-CoA-carboxylase] ligase [Chthoniobacterales bacterium]
MTLLDPDEISARFSPAIIGRKIQVYLETASTNDVAMRLARAGASEGIVIFAESQTAGRGRLGRRWQSAAGRGLWFSVLLRPKWPDFSRVGLAAAVAVARGVDRFLPEPAGIKWPNDIYLRGDRKTAGILCESGSGFVVVGIGLNVNHLLDDFAGEVAHRATSLALVAGRQFDRAGVAASVLDEFDRIYGRLPHGFPEIVAECERRSVLLGKTVRINGISGTVLGLDPNGGLHLRQDNDREVVVTAGEISMLELVPQ